MLPDGTMATGWERNEIQHMNQEKEMMTVILGDTLAGGVRREY